MGLATCGDRLLEEDALGRQLHHLLPSSSTLNRCACCSACRHSSLSARK
jgi:hypothetical protein